MVARLLYPCEVILCQSVSRQLSTDCCAFPWIGRWWQAGSSELVTRKLRLFRAWGRKPVLLLQELAAFGTFGSRTGLSLELDLSQQVWNMEHGGI